MTLFAKLLRSKVFVWIVLILPGLWPAWPIFRQDPSVLADPGKFILHHLGFTTCVLLAVVLVLSPLRVLFPKWPVAQAVNRHRRLVGVSVFAYALLHFTMYIIYEGGFATLANDIGKPFILSGVVALGLLFVLAVTSFNRLVRALGRNWKRLHRAVYVIAALAAYHQIGAQKIFPMQVVWIFGPVVVLEAARIWKQASKRSADSPRSAPEPARTV